MLSYVWYTTSNLLKHKAVETQPRSSNMRLATILSLKTLQYQMPKTACTADLYLVDMLFSIWNTPSSNSLGALG